MIKENELRDLVCEKISILGNDLIFLNKEQYIPNTLGTRGFIDIYAKDKDNNHVLIELKRSNQAVRQAMHEVIKYAEGVKSHFGANDDEIKLIIASTEWDELLVPFSSLTYNTSLSIKGIKIHLNSNEIAAEAIEPLKYNKGRFISPNYEAFWYKDEGSLDKGISSIQKTLKAAGINNFLLSILKAPKPITSPSKERRKEVLIEIARLSNIETKDTSPELFTYIVFI
ncbi:endonuclease NucS [Xenorhabdus bovienii]|uniref:Endonuclease NucS n=1 Tax=Xenorhabdus bovienii TaxID=40576 RepID=A0AAJ1N3Q6_XENBV|nr:endonuclease NucS domain-containing protein [Xenorhabdus bovienii]MDE1480567.1 endonuclease NucS [Xenorhabdus bovienii]MDE9512276.1 endonuclease NucS [Xenorhabdus bovienii]MDE9523919.1 endonuclease NucS [Xenorhabdus bovienii]